MTVSPLILIAGWGHTGTAMHGLRDALHGRPIKVTSPGELGQSQAIGALPQSPGLSRYAVGLYNLLANFGGHAVVIGWSMGGIVALETAKKYQNLLQRLVIISGTARFCAGNDEPPGVSSAVLRAMNLGLRRTPETVMAAYYDQVNAPQNAPTTDTTARAQDITLPDRDELRRGLDYLQQTDVHSGLRQFNVPTLVLHGREDRIVPWQAGAWLSRALVAGHWHCYEGLGHALPTRATALLAADIRAFLGDAS